MSRVREGELPWTNLDSLHRASLEELLEEFGITPGSTRRRRIISIAPGTAWIPGPTASRG